MSYISIPSRFTTSDPTTGVSAAYYYGTFATSVATTTDKTALWKVFIDECFTSESAKNSFFLVPKVGGGFTEKSLYDIMTASGASWPPQDLKTYKDYTFIEGMFASALKSFFYDYASSKGSTAQTAITGNQGVAENFRAYLRSSTREAVAKKQNTILLWVWEVLLKVLSETNQAAPTKGGYLLAMTEAEDKCATALQAINYQVQTSGGDYARQTANMEEQKKAEVLRSKRASAGKKGQAAQAMITQLRDQASQQAQLMSTLVQTMEGLFQSIIKK